MNKFSFVGIPCPLVEIKKPTVFQGLSFQTTCIFTDYRFVFEIRNRTDGRKEERERGDERRKVGWIGGWTDGHRELCELSVFP
jgi:hypothetical protein